MTGITARKPYYDIGLLRKIPRQPSCDRYVDFTRKQICLQRSIDTLGMDTTDGPTSSEPNTTEHGALTTTKRRISARSLAEAQL